MSFTDHLTPLQRPACSIAGCQYPCQHVNLERASSLPAAASAREHQTDANGTAGPLQSSHLRDRIADAISHDLICTVGQLDVAKMADSVLAIVDPDDGATDEERVDATCERLTLLEDALKSRNHTVQVMPDGIEVIVVASGDMVRKFALTEVPVA